MSLPDDFTSMIFRWFAIAFLAGFVLAGLIAALIYWLK
jgi:hypothetical protein